MLARTGHGDCRRGNGRRLLRVYPFLINEPRDLVVEQILLRLHIAVGGADKGVVARLAAVGYHLDHGIGRACIHELVVVFISPGHLSELGLITLFHLVPGIDQSQKLGALAQGGCRLRGGRRLRSRSGCRTGCRFRGRLRCRFWRGCRQQHLCKAPQGEDSQQPCHYQNDQHHNYDSVSGFLHCHCRIPKCSSNIFTPMKIRITPPAISAFAL